MRGCDRVDKLSPRNLESAALKMERVTRDIDEITREISDIAEDGQITPEERPTIEENLDKPRAVKKSIKKQIIVVSYSASRVARLGDCFGGARNDYIGQKVGAASDTGAADPASTGADQAAQVKQDTALS